jgi:hypothetical protein
MFRDEGLEEGGDESVGEYGAGGVGYCAYDVGRCGEFLLCIIRRG